MTPSKSQCDPARLRLLLDEKLPAKSQDDLSKHLESCADCRRELESLAAGPDWWNDAQQLLSTIVNFKNSTSADNVQNDIKNQTSTDNVLSAGNILTPNAEVSRLGFLSPSDDPTKLGRLGPYEIVKVIGRGGMGIVLKGFDSALNRFVAIKVLAPQWMHSAAARHRFAREAQAAAAVAHEHVISIYAVDSANETPYLVMPFIDGRSLQERIDKEGPLNVEEVLRIGIQIAAGLAAAHAQGLVHRDIKPANILLENGVERVLITDFGLARAVDDASFTRSCFIAGTPEYMAPEQANGEFVDHRIDLFSLGSVMYTMCTGQSPFRRETTMAVLRQICEGTARPIREINRDVPIWLMRIIEKLHAKDPADRYQSAGEVVELLKAWLAHVQQPSAHPRPSEPSERWRVFAGFSRRLPQVRWAAAAALLLMFAGLTITETTGKTHLLRLVFSAGETALSATGPSLPAVLQANTPSAKENTFDLYADKETVFEKRIADLWRQFHELETKLSAGDSSDASPNTLQKFRLQLADLQAELPEYRQDPQQYQLEQVRAGIERLNRPPSPRQSTGGVDSSLMEINDRIQQLDKDLYKDFP
jgi:eukaryotic-like serine/threonine-protein kinase